ncbi:SGNH/GDSL hydrolase family protein (plasmid) [Rhodobacteraceae bacterium SC52]|nr:SGNH/GDSL hydrolase family protein [Rhodobacteraceae bacterium SC52]
MRLSIFSFESSKKFSLLRTLLFLTVFLVILKALSWCTRETSFPIMPSRVSAFELADSLDVSAITIGASYNVNISFDLLEMSHVPLWLPSADIFETEKIFEQFLLSGGAPDYAFMILDFSQLYQDNGTRQKLKSLNPSPRDQAYILTTINSAFSLIEGDILGWLEASFFPPRGIFHLSHTRALHSAFVNAIDPPERSPSARFEFPQLSDPAAPDQIQIVVDFITRLVVTTVNEDPEILDRSIAALQRIAELAAQSNVKLIVIAGAPLVRPYEEALARATKAAELSIVVDKDVALARASKALVNGDALVIPLSDVWDREVDGMRLDWFADNRHLNARGADIFTQRLEAFLSVP